MQIRNVSRGDLLLALDTANASYAGNLRFKRLGPDGQTRSHSPKWIVTLTVNSSRAPGARRGPDGRRIAAACWHAHGAFFDALPPHAEIITSSPNYNAPRPLIQHPGEPYRDWNAGSHFYPALASELCECE